MDKTSESALSFSNSDVSYRRMKPSDEMVVRRTFEDPPGVVIRRVSMAFTLQAVSSSALGNKINEPVLMTDKFRPYRAVAGHF